MANQIAASVIKVAKHLQRCNCVQATPAITRSLSTAADTSTLSEHIKNKQEVFQTPEDTPVYIKGGIVDRLLFGVTAGCCVVSLLLIAKTFIEMALPKKKH